MGIDTGVIKVDGGENDVQQGFCTFELALEGFNVLGGCISSTVGRLVVGTVGASAKRRAGGRARQQVPFCRRVSGGPTAGRQGERQHTIAVDGAVCAGLLSVALYFFASTFIACAGYTPPLLHGLRLWGAGAVVGDIVGRGVVEILNFGALGMWRWVIGSIEGGVAFSSGVRWRGHDGSSRGRCGGA